MGVPCPAELESHYHPLFRGWRVGAVCGVAVSPAQAPSKAQQLIWLKSDQYVKGEAGLWYTPVTQLFRKQKHKLENHKLEASWVTSETFSEQIQRPGAGAEQ